MNKTLALIVAGLALAGFGDALPDQVNTDTHRWARSGSVGRNDYVLTNVVLGNVKVALSNVTNVNGTAVTADSLNAYTKTETDAKIAELAPPEGNYATVSNKAMTALQSFTEQDPTFSTWYNSNGYFGNLYALDGDETQYTGDEIVQWVVDDSARIDELENAGYISEADAKALKFHVSSITNAAGTQISYADVGAVMQVEGKNNAWLDSKFHLSQITNATGGAIGASDVGAVAQVEGKTNAWRDDQWGIHQITNGNEAIYRELTHAWNGERMMLQLPGEEFVIGSGNTYGGYNDVLVMGTGIDNSYGQYVTAYGFDLTVGNYAAAAFGNNAEADAPYAAALGYDAVVDSDGMYGLALQGAYVDGTSAFAAMPGARATEDYSVALGSSAIASNQLATALGALASAHGKQSIAVGTMSSAKDFGSIAIGMYSSVSGTWNVAVGPEATITNCVNGVAIGEQAFVDSAHYGVALGVWSKVRSPYGIAIRGEVQKNSEAGIAVGDRARSKHPHSIVISARNQNSTPSGYYDSHGDGTVNIDVSSPSKLYFGEMTAEQFFNIVSRTEMTNIVRAIAASYWDQGLGVTWTSDMNNGTLRYYATTNVNVNAGN